MANQNNIFAYLALGAGVLALSFSAMFVRWADAPGPVTAFYRMFFSIFLLFPFFIQRTWANPSTRTREILFPMLAGIFTALDLALWTSALSYTTAANATLLGNTAPLWVALGTWLILKQRLGVRFWSGLALTLSGAALIVGTDFIFHPRFGIGDLMATFTGFFYGGYYLFTERSRMYFGSISHVFLVGVGASATLFVVNTFLQYPLTGYDLRTWLIFLATALVSQIIGYMALAYALGHLPASLVAPTMVLQPVVTAILAIPLLGEIPTVWQGVGGVVVLAGIYLVNLGHNKKIRYNAGTYPKEELIMDVKVFTENGRVPITVIHVDGNLDSSTFGNFQAKAEELIAGGARYILIDLTHVKFISSAGFRAFNELFNRLRAINPDANLSEAEIRKGISAGTYKSPHLKLLNLPEEAQTSFHLAGFDLFLESYTDMKTAVASF